MSVELSWASLAVVASLAVHGLSVIRATIVMSENIKSMRSELIRMGEELTKRDAQMLAAWRKIDHMNERLIRVEAKNHIPPGSWEKNQDEA